MSNAKVPVTVIGLGPMGQAMVRQFLEAGNPVTVWNRTESKADVLVKEGAVKAASLAEALETNTLVVVSLTHYEAVRAVQDIYRRSLDASEKKGEPVPTYQTIRGH